jgi:hypothetical protein
MNSLSQLDQVKTTPWSGGRSPWSVEYGKIMMWFFLLSDAFTFSSLLVYYGAQRFTKLTWPDPDLVFQSIPWIDGKKCAIGIRGYHDFYPDHELCNYGTCSRSRTQTL